MSSYTYATIPSGNGGMFPVPSVGEYQRHVSGAMKMAASRRCFVQVSGLWGRWDPDTSAMIPVGDTAVSLPMAIGSDSTGVDYVSEVLFHAPAPADATHWAPRLYWYAQHPSISDDGISDDVRILIDDIYIPDNGYPMAGIPYLDGDRPYGVWEGGRWSSTSIYGQGEVVLLGGPEIDGDLLIPDETLSFHLDFDFTFPSPE